MTDADERDAQSPSTDPLAPTPPDPRRRMVVVGIVAIIVLVSVGGIVWAMTLTSEVDPDPPEAQFDVDYTDDGRVVLSHGGGVTLRADRVVVVVGDERATWADLRFDVADSAKLTAGDRTPLLGVDPGDTIEIRYVVDGESVLVGELTVPGN